MEVGGPGPPTQCIVVTRHVRTFRLDVEDGLPTFAKDDVGDLLSGTIGGHVHDPEPQHAATVDAVQTEFVSSRPRDRLQGLRQLAGQ